MTSVNQADRLFYNGQLVNRVYAGSTQVWPLFKPTDIANCVIWLDASRITGVANGGDVTFMTNWGSGPAPIMIGNPPTPKFRTNALNTVMPCVRIIGTQGKFRFTGTGIDKDYTILFVARRMNGSVGRVISVEATTANILWGFWGDRMECAYVEGWLAPDVVVPSTAQFKLYSADATSTAVARLFSNGTLLRSGATTPAKGVGGTLNISGSSSTGECADCEFAEVVMYSRRLSDAERQAVEKYLREKWFGGALWTPTDLGSSLVAWFDSSDASVQQTGSGVSNWVNKGVGGMTLTQGTDANRPTVQGYGVNFAQTAQAMVAANAPSSYDAVMVCRPNAKPTPDDWRTLLRSATGHEMIIESTSTRLGTYSGGFLPAGGLTWGAVDGLACMRVAPSQAVQISRDGGALTSTGTALGAGSAAPTMFGAYISPPPSQGFGAVKEMIFMPYNTEAQRQRAEGYLAHKWGLESLLPGGHPYKSAPP